MLIYLYELPWWVFVLSLYRVSHYNEYDNKSMCNI